MKLGKMINEYRNDDGYTVVFRFYEEKTCRNCGMRLYILVKDNCVTAPVSEFEKQCSNMAWICDETLTVFLVDDENKQLRAVITRPSMDKNYSCGDCKMPLFRRHRIAEGAS